LVGKRVREWEEVIGNISRACPLQVVCLEILHGRQTTDKRSVTMRRFLALAVPVLVCAVCMPLLTGANSGTPTPLSENELASTAGALFGTCESGAGSCPSGSCSTAGVTCTQEQQGPSYFCWTTGGTAGCTAGGSYNSCVGWCHYCPYSGARACGLYKYPHCDQAWGVCSGTASCTGSNNCRTNC